MILMQYDFYGHILTLHQIYVCLYGPLWIGNEHVVLFELTFF